MVQLGNSSSQALLPITPFHWVRGLELLADFNISLGNGEVFVELRIPRRDRLVYSSMGYGDG